MLNVLSTEDMPLKDAVTFVQRHFRQPKFEITGNVIRITEHKKPLMRIEKEGNRFTVLPLANDERIVDVAIDLGGDLL